MATNKMKTDFKEVNGHIYDRVRVFIQIRGRIWDQVRDQIGWQVGVQVWSQVNSHILDGLNEN